MKSSQSVIDAIGSTPLVELSRLARSYSGRLLVKLESMNPGSSKKGRIVRQIIEDAASRFEMITPSEKCVQRRRLSSDWAFFSYTSCSASGESAADRTFNHADSE